jgi:hypothetical protein
MPGTGAIPTPVFFALNVHNPLKRRLLVVFRETKMRKRIKRKSLWSEDGNLVENGKDHECGIVHFRISKSYRERSSRSVYNWQSILRFEEDVKSVYWR